MAYVTHKGFFFDVELLYETVFSSDKQVFTVSRETDFVLGFIVNLLIIVFEFFLGNVPLLHVKVCGDCEHVFVAGGDDQVVYEVVVDDAPVVGY